MFHDALVNARREASAVKRRAKLVRLITLGFVDLNSKVRQAEKALARAEVESDRYRKLRSKAKQLDDELLTVVEVDGVRVSKNTFADCSRLGAEDYPRDWQQLRKMVLARDNHQCTELSSSCNGPLQIHHVVPLSKGGTNDPQNLVTLCFCHHSDKHPHMKEKYRGNIWR